MAEKTEKAGEAKTKPSLARLDGILDRLENEIEQQHKNIGEKIIKKT